MENTITMYNHWMKFNDHEGNFDRIDETRTKWTPNRELAEQRMAEDVEWVNSNVTFVKLADHGIVKKEHPTKIVLSGELGDNGGSYANVDIAVGGTDLYSALYEKYSGCNVKLTMEILP